MNTEKFIEKLNREVRKCNATLEEWKENFEKDPAYAFKWGSEAVEASARVTIYSRVLASLTGEEAKSLELVAKIATANVMQAARFPAQSTSPMSNLVSQYELGAWARIVEWLED